MMVLYISLSEDGANILTQNGLRDSDLQRREFLQSDLSLIDLKNVGEMSESGRSAK